MRCTSASGDARCVVKLCYLHLGVEERSAVSIEKGAEFGFGHDQPPRNGQCDLTSESLSDLFAVLPHLANERDRASRIVERDVVADLLQVNFGLGRELRAHSLRALFDHFGVLAFQTIKYLGGGFRFTAAATRFDFAT